ncbi:MAG: hypothetical protein FWE36_00165 [Erysipelotrichales bacterium]|nr:hypothetical protein [Erysipelotrichales bacterium]
MEKTINISGNDYRLKSSLFTIISYKNTFGSELFSDIAVLDKKNDASEDTSQVIDTIFKIFYVLHKPFSSKSYDEFLNEFGFDILSNEDQLTKLAETIAELFNNTKKG